jgi:hypothetical protein
MEDGDIVDGSTANEAVLVSMQSVVAINIRFIDFPCLGWGGALHVACPSAAFGEVNRRKAACVL